MDEHADGVYRFVLKNCRDSELARDLVQESFMRLWINRKEVNFQKGKSWLFSTAYHAMIDDFRRNDRMNSMEDGNHNPPHTDEQYSDIKEVLDRALEMLPDIQRSVVLLRDYEGYSYKEIGEITGLSESQVKVYIYRARLFLKKYIVSPEMVI